MCLTANNFGLPEKHKHLQTAGKDHQLGKNGMWYHRKRERETDGQNERGRRKMLPSEQKNTIEQFILYVHRNETHFTYIYVYHTNVFEADNIYKALPQMSFHLYSLLFFPLCAPSMTLLTAEALTDQLGAPPPTKIPATPVVAAKCRKHNRGKDSK